MRLRETYLKPNRYGNQALRLLQRLKYGRCEVNIPKKSVTVILVSEILNPFYIFQIFSVILWTWDHYYTYAACILLISTSSVIISLVETI